ncbi:MAG: hypothetical protein AAF570_09395, partial [Bacteroidota bacterium]
IDLIPKASQNMLDRMVGGREIDQEIGFIGESLLPAPAIGYASVIEKDIHTGLTAPGFIHHEFYTARDEIFSSEHTGILKNQAAFPTIAVGQNFISSFNALSATQGFSFLHTQLHGQKKRYTTYGGVLAGDQFDPATANRIASKEWEYFKHNEGVPILKKLGDQIEKANLGAEMEIAMAGRTVREDVAGLMLSLEATIGLMVPAPVVHFIPLPGHKTISSILETHTTSKVVSYPPVLKAVRTMADGMHGGEDYLAYDPATGAPAVVSQTDAFHGLRPGTTAGPHNGRVLTYAMPAAPDYPAFSSKSGSEGRGAEFPAKQWKRGDTLELRTNASGCRSFGWLIPGDLVQLQANRTSGDVLNFTGAEGLYYVHTFDALKLQLVKHSSNTQHQQVSNTDRKIQLRLIHTARNNRVNATTTDLQIYGQDKLQPTSRGSIQAFQALEINLNNRLKGLSAAQPYSLIRSLPGMKVRDPRTGECHPAQDAKVGIIALTRKADGSVEVYSEFGTKEACRSNLPVPKEGLFRVDPETGEVRYHLNAYDCIGIPINCLQFCDPQVLVLDQALSATTQTFRDEWPHELDERFPAGASSYEKGELGRWRSTDNLQYRSETELGSKYGKPARVYKAAGTFDDFVPYNHQIPAMNDSLAWLRTASATQYNENGHLAESVDERRRPTATQYGYDGLLPVAVAVNAGLDEVIFVGFETAKSAGDMTDFDGWKVRKTHRRWEGLVAHTGEKCIEMKAALRLPDKQMKALQGKDVEVNVWVRFEKEEEVPDLLESFEIQEKLLNSQVRKTPMEHIARVGEWNLFRAKFRAQNATMVHLHHRFGNPVRRVWLDDLCIRPADADVTAIVYDRHDFKQLARFGTQHFAELYQYDLRGRLVRRILETERGRKTVAETHYNLPKEGRTK